MLAQRNRAVKEAAKENLGIGGKIGKFINL